MKRRGSPNSGVALARFADVVATFVKQPRTILEMAEVVGIRGKGLTYQYVEVLREEGLLYICEWRLRGGAWTPVYAWQPSVLYYSDAPHPAASLTAGFPLLDACNGAGH